MSEGQMDCMIIAQEVPTLVKIVVLVGFLSIDISITIFNCVFINNSHSLINGIDKNRHLLSMK